MEMLSRFIFWDLFFEGDSDQTQVPDSLQKILVFPLSIVVVVFFFLLFCPSQLHRLFVAFRHLISDVLAIFSGI